MTSLYSRFLLILLLLSPAGYCQSWSLGVINERLDKPDHAYEQYGKLHEYLTDHLADRGIKLEPLVIAENIQHLSSLIGQGRVDMFIEGVMPTLEIHRQTGKVEESLLAWRKGQRQYHSVFFSRKDSRINSLDELSGKRIVFESPRSTSAYFIPRATLLQNGYQLVNQDTETVEQSPYIEYLFSGSELNQAYWVTAGKADIGAFNDGDWERLPEALQSELQIIHSTPPVLRWLFSYIAGVDAETKTTINQILLTAHRNPDGIEALQDAARIAKFEQLTDDDLENLEYWREIFTQFD